MKVVIVLNITVFLMMFGLGIYVLSTNNVTVVGYACMWIMLMIKMILEIMHDVREVKKEEENETSN